MAVRESHTINFVYQPLTRPIRRSIAATYIGSVSTVNTATSNIPNLNLFFTIVILLVMLFFVLLLLKQRCCIQAPKGNFQTRLTAALDLVNESLRTMLLWILMISLDIRRIPTKENDRISGRFKILAIIKM